MDVLNVTRKLQEAGCRFVISVPWLPGMKTVMITSEQAALLLRDPTALYAEIADLPVPAYMEWRELGGTVLCRAHTVQGRPCRNPINGGTSLEPEAWAALTAHGGYCSVHGG